MNHHREKVYFLIFLAMLGIIIASVYAGGPLAVTGVDADQPGQPYRWILNPIPYRTDQGGLGNQSNTQANDLVSSAFQVWGNVSTAAINIENSGSLDSDINSTNIFTFLNAVQNCSDITQPTASIIYDVDGSIITAMGGDNNSTLGFAGNVCANDEAGIYTRGLSLLNGRFIDGQPATPGHNTVSINVFRRVFVHEFGHLLGLDHAQINLNCLTEISCPSQDWAGVPVMFPILMEEAGGNLKVDDIAAISRLYPDPSFSATTGRIQGRVFFSDGQTQAQGYNVIARKVGDPRTTAASNVSGFLFTASAGNAFYPDPQATESPYGSRDQTLIGYYDIAGLPPGDYTIEVEAIYNSSLYSFTGGSSVGPIGDYADFQFKMPGICNPQYLNFPSNPSDSCSASTTVTVGAGSVVSTNTDVILLGTPSRFDAWEDEP